MTQPPPPALANLEIEPEDWRQASFEHWVRVALVPNEMGDETYEALQKELHDIQGSISWRVTAPLRVVRRWTR